jgi:predicted Zn-dependent protease
MLANYSIEREHFDEALNIAERYYDMSPDNYIMGMLYAKALLLNGKYEQCVQLLGKLDILPYEGATDGRLLYRESKLMLALQRMKSKSFREALHEVDNARLWPENLGVGKPYPQDVDERLEDWLALKCYERQNASHESDSLMQKIISTDRKEYGTGTLISAWALQRAGRQTNAENLLKEWLTREPESGLAKWCQSVFKGKGEEVPEGISGDESFRVLKELLSIH